MSSNYDSYKKDAIETISSWIRSEIGIVQREKRAPGGDPDRSDDVIADGEKKINVLRHIRQQIEDLEES